MNELFSAIRQEKGRWFELLTLATYVTQPVTRSLGWCRHWVLSVAGTPKRSSDGPRISRCSDAWTAPLWALGGFGWGGGGAGLFLRALSVPVVLAFVPVTVTVPEFVVSVALDAVVVGVGRPLSCTGSGSFSRISSFSCWMFVFYRSKQSPSVTSLLRSR